MSVPVCHGLGGTLVCIRGSLACLGWSSWQIVHDLVISSVSMFRFLQNTDDRALSWSSLYLGGWYAVWIGFLLGGPVEQQFGDL